MIKFGNSAAAADMGDDANDIRTVTPFDYVRVGGLRIRRVAV